MSYLGRSAKLSLKAQEKVSFLATAGQTVKTGLSYVPSFVEVYVNGVLLTDTTDFTATNGNSITFTVALLLNDEVTVISLKTFTVADHYTKSDADTLLSAKATNTALATTNTAVALKAPIASPVFTGIVQVGNGTGGAGGVKYPYGGSADTRNWRTRSDIASYGDWGIEQSTTKTGETYATKLLINPAGIVTKPLQPAFKAGMSNDVTLSSTAPVIFTDTGSHHFNTGNHYSTSTGRFTAPVAGIYHFFALILYSNISSGSLMYDKFYVYKNSTNVAYSSRRGAYVANTTGNAGYYSDWATVTLNLAANDYVYILSKADTIHGNTAYTYFTGHLIG